MKKIWIFRAVKFTVIAAAVVSVVSFAVMTLWNGLVPPVFGWHEITIAQALGLLVLSRILFGGFRGRGHWRGRFMDRWSQMTPEQQAQFRQGMQHRCGSWGRRFQTEPHA